MNTHTIQKNAGLFCCHVVLAFTHLFVDYIPSKYILKRYTRNPYIETNFDRHDNTFLGPDGETKAQRAACILPSLFKLQRSAIMSAEVSK